MYLVLAIPRFPALWATVIVPELTSFQTFLTDSGAAAGLWAQVIACDLLVGRWMYLDSRERGVHPLLMGPLLVFTILLSPFGLLIYLAIRAARPVRHRRPQTATIKEPTAW